MSIFVRRQFAARCGQGSHSQLPDLPIIGYRFTDVSPRNVLKLDADKITSGYMMISANTSFALPLPEGYSSANYLAVVLRGNAICRAVLVDSVLGTSTFLLKGTSGTTKGNHPGVISFQGHVTSVTVNVPVAFDDCLLEYFMYEIPDLTVPGSWQNGSQTIGVITTT